MELDKITRGLKKEPRVEKAMVVFTDEENDGKGVFYVTKEGIDTSAFIVCVDVDSNKTTVLKNRYGKNGEIVSSEYINRLKTEVQEYKELVEKMKPVYEIGKEYQKAIKGIQ